MLSENDNHGQVLKVKHLNFIIIFFFDSLFDNASCDFIYDKGEFELKKELIY